jgi:putative inorganic carbon (HCO3(-)) transporter
MKGLLFTYGLTYVGGVMALFNPFHGLLIYVCFSIVQPESMWYWSVPAGNYSRIVALALLIGWALKGYGNWNFGRARGIVIALMCYWLWMTIGATMAGNQSVAWTFVESQSKVFLPFLVGITTIDSVQKLKQLAWVLAMSQGYVAYEMNLAYFEGFNRLVENGHAGMDNNSVAIVMVTGVGVAFFLGLEATSWWQKIPAYGASALMVHSVLFSFSRGGMLALIITAVIVFVLIPKQPKHFVMAALGVVIALQLAGKEVRERFASTFGEGEGHMEVSAQSRLDLWKDCVDSMLKRPLFGVGPDHWGLVVKEYGWAAGKQAHTLWLQIGAELGILALMFLFAFYGLCILRLFPLALGFGKVADPWFRSTARMAIASLVGFIVAAQFVSLTGMEMCYYVALLGAGALKVHGEQQIEDSTDGNEAVDDESYGSEFTHSEAEVPGGTATASGPVS